MNLLVQRELVGLLPSVDVVGEVGSKGDTIECKPIKSKRWWRNDLTFGAHLDFNGHIQNGRIHILPFRYFRCPEEFTLKKPTVLKACNYIYNGFETTRASQLTEFKRGIFKAIMNCLAVIIVPPQSLKKFLSIIASSVLEPAKNLIIAHSISVIQVN